MRGAEEKKNCQTQPLCFFKPLFAWWIWIIEPNQRQTVCDHLSQLPPAWWREKEPLQQSSQTSVLEKTLYYLPQQDPGLLIYARQSLQCGTSASRGVVCDLSRVRAVGCHRAPPSNTFSHRPLWCYVRSSLRQESLRTSRPIPVMCCLSGDFPPVLWHCLFFDSTLGDSDWNIKVGAAKLERVISPQFRGARMKRREINNHSVRDRPGRHWTFLSGIRETCKLLTKEGGGQKRARLVNVPLCVCCWKSWFYYLYHTKKMLFISVFTSRMKKGKMRKRRWRT